MEEERYTLTQIYELMNDCNFSFLTIYDFKRRMEAQKVEIQEVKEKTRYYEKEKKYTVEEFGKLLDKYGILGEDRLKKELFNSFVKWLERTGR